MKIPAFDQGTASSRAILFDEKCAPLGAAILALGGITGEELPALRECGRIYLPRQSDSFRQKAPKGRKKAAAAARAYT